MDCYNSMIVLFGATICK